MDAILEFLVTSVGLKKEQLNFLTRAAWVIFVSFHILWVCGWLGTFGLQTPFANAVDTQAIADAVKEERIERLDHDILQTRTSQCQAMDPKVKQQYTERLQELVNRYWAVAKRAPRVPGCDEV